MNVECETAPPPLRLKLGFWMLLGVLSTAFAEVVSGSDPFPFFRPWGVIVVTPLYTLHVLVLAGVLNRYRLWSWQGLCFAGALFGLYEAYITKVLWRPTWSPELVLRAWDVSWPHTILLILWWHPLMAFIVPLCVAEILLTKSRRVVQCLPRRLRARLARHSAPLLAAFFALACAMLTSAPASSAPQVLLSAGANCLLLTCLILMWRKFTKGIGYEMSQLLPGGRGLLFLSTLLLFFYAVTGAVLRPEAFPSLEGHLAIAALYALFIAALLRSRHFAVVDEEDSPAPVSNGSMWMVLAFAAIYTGGTALLEWMLGPATIVFALIHWVGALLGLCVYAYAFYSLRRTPTLNGVCPVQTPTLG